MKKNSIDLYWKGLTQSSTAGELQHFLTGNQVMAEQALTEISALLKVIDPIGSSNFTNNLVDLGLMISGTAGKESLNALLKSRSLFNEAVRYLNDGQKEKAIEALSSAGFFSNQVENEAQAVELTNFSVIFLLRLAQYDEAFIITERLFNQLALRKQIEASGQLFAFLSICKYLPASLAWIELLKRAYTIVKSRGQLLVANGILCHIGILWIRSGAFEKGLNLLNDTVSLLSGAGYVSSDNEVYPFDEAFLIPFWKARALDSIGREEEANTHFKGYLLTHTKEEKERDKVIVQLAELLVENNLLLDALDLLQEYPIADTKYKAYALFLKSYIYLLLNRSELSLNIYNKALSVLNEELVAGDHLSHLEMMVIRQIDKNNELYEPDEIYWKIELMKVSYAIASKNVEEENRQTVEKGLAWARKLEEHFIEVRCLQLLGHLSLASGDVKGALTIFRQAYECELSHGRPADLPCTDDEPPVEFKRSQIKRKRILAGVGIETQYEIGKVLNLSGSDPTAEWDVVIGGARRRNKRLLLYYTLNAKAEWLISKDHKKEAILLWEEAIDILDGLRTEFKDIESQIYVLQDKEIAFANLLTSAVKERNSTIVLRLMERAKARVLLEELSRHDQQQQMSPASAEQAKSLRQDLVRAMREQRNKMAGQKNIINSLKEQLALVFHAEKKNTAVVSLSGGSAEEVIRYSSGGKAVLHYFVTRQHIVLAGAVDGKILEPVLINCSKDTLANLLDTLHDENATRTECYSLSELHSILIKPVEQQLHHVKELVIIPHDLLHHLPFHALKNKQGKYLLENFSVRYLPSIAVALYLESFKNDKENKESIILATGMLSYIDFPALGSVDMEIQSITQSIPNIRVYRDTGAVRRLILQNMQDIEVLHFSCHGDYDLTDPLLSRLYLGDGPLYGYEIERLSFRTRLVVLSACETAVQQRFAGDETFGLVRAFLSAGTSAVIASLWKVPDESTGLLMRSFYQYYAAAKNDISAALRMAQLSLLSSKEYSHPFWWSAYSLIGNNF